MALVFIRIEDLGGDEAMADLVRRAKPVLDPASGEPLRDDEPVLRGIDAGLGVARLRAQILGLDAPQRHHLVDEAGNTLEITRLIPMLRRLGIVVDAEE